jgi:aromatic-L-amino-acid decarboxylase
MTPQEFRRRGHEVIDWIARYMEEVERYPVLSRVQPGAVRAQLPPRPPETGEPFEHVMRDLEGIILPGLTHWQSPNFFAYFPSNGSGPAILGDMLSTGLGVQGMLWATSPACTELETHVLDWLVGMLGLPETFLSTSRGGGVIQDTASSATLCALLAARERARKWNGGDADLDRRLTVYGSTQTHSSLEKAVKIAGIPRENLRLIDVDEAYSMRATALEEAITRDRRAGLVPCMVCATIGTTSSNAIDPVAEMGSICTQDPTAGATGGTPVPPGPGPGAWLHVDAAMSGTAALCEEFRWIHDGVEHADSYCFNPHKWMFTSFDCDCFWVADRAALTGALSVMPEYLRNAATTSGGVIDYRDWQIPLGRRFRALKLWLVIRHYGVEGLRHHVREHVRLAQRFAEWVRADERFELAAPAPLNLVCFRLRGRDDETNQRLLESLNAGGRIHLTHTRLGGAYTLRMSIGGTWTEERHVEQAWRLIGETAAQVLR